MDDQEVVFLTLATGITILLISLGLVLFLVFFVQTKRRSLTEKFRLMEAYEKELSSTKIEIKDQTLKQVGLELHDNIGQLLTVTRIHLKTLLKTVENEKLTEVNNITGRALDELRQLSKSLINNDAMKNLGLVQMIEGQVAFIEKTGVIKSQLKVVGEPYRFDAGHEIICFRIMQEFVANALKYSGCEHIYFELEYQPAQFSFVVKEDGKGFNPQQVVKGNGLNNIEHRAKMIGAAYQLETKEGKGTSIHVTLKTQDVTV